MIAAAALERQIECDRRMTGEPRLAIALDLREMSRDIAGEGIRRSHPNAQPNEVERLLHRQLALARAE